ncbi:MAG TPA: DNA polymerase I, partial [bacterium (Candidatus Stahlbacteria)]|nr:DNA polymerase I [Candidatus Stahlbacteria bacterium]
QLLSPRIKIMDPRDFKTYDESSAEAKLGIPPSRVTDFLALTGDAIDNIPGVAGIGPKTAVELIRKFGSLEDIYNNLNRIEKNRIKELLNQYREEAFLSKDLVTIETNADIELKGLERREPDERRLFEILRELELFSIMKRLSTHKEKNFEISESAEVFLNEVKDKIGIVFLPKQYENSNFFSLSIEKGQASVFRGDLSPLKAILSNPKILKITPDVKSLFSKFDVQGEVFDTLLASYLLKPGIKEHSLEYLGLQYLGVSLASLQDLLGKGRTKKRIGELSPKLLANYLGERASIILELEERLKGELKDKALYELLVNVEIPLAKVLSNMERNGVLIDRNYFKNESARLAKELEILEHEIYELAGEQFNIRSPKQIAHILFKKLGLPHAKRTKTGYSTDFDTLTKLAQQYELPRKILEYREFFKLKSTYIDAIPALADPVTDRVRTTWTQTVTATGRLSSVNPNLQNIPKKEIRKGFIAPKRSVILACDYSQIELRIVASLSEDTRLMEAFKNNEDIHAKTAQLIFNETGDKARRKAKVVNFGIIYGMGPYGLSKELNISVGEADLFIRTYFLTYPGVKAWIDNTLKEAHEKGYVSTILGRRRYFDEINSENVRTREFEERAAINAPVQGSAADMIKVAMINIDKEFNKQGLKTKMIMQVHDELVFEVPEEELDEVKDLVKEKMETAIPLRVPVVVDMGVGKNWYEAH